VNDQINSEITRIWQLHKEGKTSTEIAKATNTSVGHVRRRIRFKSDYDRGDVLNLSAGESRKKYGSVDISGLCKLAFDFDAGSFKIEFYARLREEGLSAHVGRLVEGRRLLLDATVIPRVSVLLIPGERFWGDPWRRSQLNTIPEVNTDVIASFDMMLHHLQNSGTTGSFELVRTSLAGLGRAALRFSDDVSDRVERRVGFAGWPELPEKATGRVDQLVRVITWDLEERAAGRSMISGKIEKGYSASGEPYWSPFGAFPFECPTEKDATDMLAVLVTLRNEVDRSRVRTRLKTAVQAAGKEATTLRAMIEPIDRFDNMLRRGYCSDCPKEPLSG
jgi:hypothetical protein